MTCSEFGSCGLFLQEVDCHPVEAIDDRRCILLLYLLLISVFESRMEVIVFLFSYT